MEIASGTEYGAWQLVQEESATREAVCGMSLEDHGRSNTRRDKSYGAVGQLAQQIVSCCQKDYSLVGLYEGREGM